MEDRSDTFIIIVYTFSNMHECLLSNNDNNNRLSTISSRNSLVINEDIEWTFLFENGWILGIS